jgi:enoyl-CoA hydratase/3-hydroxyacyl-CoA dehydrogenase
MAGPTANYRVDPDGVAVITLANPPVNALHPAGERVMVICCQHCMHGPSVPCAVLHRLSGYKHFILSRFCCPAVLRGLFDSLARAHADPKVKAVVVTGSGKNFSAGFDINQFQNQSGGGGIDNSINESICRVLEGGPKPTVAAIQGVALGGGLEVAMGCNARVAAPGSRLGLPELQLGIIPGFGGTQRLPRLVGLKKAVQMMLTSTPIKDSDALKLGLVDAVAPAQDLLAAAKQHALDIAVGRKPLVLSLLRTDHLEPYGEALAVLDFARAESAKRARHLKHPQLCLDAIQTGVEHGGAAGLVKVRQGEHCVRV